VGQTKSVLSQIDALLAEAGSDKSRILRCQIFLSDIKNFDGMNLAWDEWVAAGNAPPRATVEARLAKAEWLVEMVVTAAQA
jgi:enamine deaminase RidA (YjgF/YER057c/UK114 family)